MKKILSKIKTSLGFGEEPKFELKMEKALCQNAKMNSGPKPMTKMQREELVRRIQAMDAEELQVVANTIPIELCHNRVRDELQQFKDMKKSQRELTAAMEGKR